MANIMDFSPLWGEWQVKELLGKGTFGTVYRAVREEYGETYVSAIKHVEIPFEGLSESTIISEGLATSEEEVSAYYDVLRDKFLSEIKTCYELKGNTNIVSYENHKVIQRPEKKGYDIFIRMEYLTPLTEYMRKIAFNEKEIIKLGIDICNALIVMQKKKIIHRDIKPANIMVNSEGVYKLGDFGEAKVLFQTMGGMSIRGTYSFMAPEVYRRDAVNQTADIYSLGMVLYRMLNFNRPPFSGDTSVKLTSELSENCNSRRFAGEAVPYPLNCGNSRLAAAVLKACSYYPQQRWHDAEQFVNELRGCLSDINLWESNTGQAGYSATVKDNEVLQQNNPYIMSESGINNGSFNYINQGVMPEINYGLNQDLEQMSYNQNMSPNAIYGAVPQYPGEENDIVIPKRKNKGLIILNSVLGFLILCIIGAGVWLLTKEDSVKEDKKDTATVMSADQRDTTETTETEAATAESELLMPQCINKSYADVKSQLEAMGMIVAAEYEDNNEVAAGCVISQNYPEGAKLSEGTEVTLVVSNGQMACPYEYEQKVAVYAPAGSSYATMKLYNWENGDWTEQFTCTARIGKNGIGLNYEEGNSVTPQGIFKLGIVLCDTVIPGNMPYKLVSSTTCVVDDVSSPFYNIICDTSEIPSDVSRDTIGDNIVNGKLDAAIFIEHNGNGFSADNVVAGKSSVITICGVDYSPVETLGCIDITSDNLRTLLGLLDTTKNPYIEIYTE